MARSSLTAAAGTVPHQIPHSLSPVPPLHGPYSNDPPLFGTYLVGTCRYHVTSHDITTLLRTAAASFPHIGFRPSDVNARSLCAGGSVAAWMPTTSGLWAGGKAMPCFAISTSRPYLWCGTSPTLCLLMALSRFSPAPTYRRAPLLYPPTHPKLAWRGIVVGRDRTSKAGYRHSPSNMLATSPTDDEQLAT